MAVAALCAVLLAPLFVVDLPPILDYPNHLARLYFLAHADDPVLSRFYAVRWGVIPDLAIDSFAPLLLRVLPVFVAGKVLLGMLLLLTVGGVLAYSRAVFGERRPWALAGGLVAANLAFLLGFLNFIAAIGLALLFAAGWIVWRDRHPVRALAVGVAGIVVLFFAHLTGVAFFLVLVGSSELECAWRGRHAAGGLATALLARMPLAAPLALVPLALYLRTRFSVVVDETIWMPWPDKLWQAAGGFMAYDFAFDIACAALVFAIMALCLALGRARIAAKSAVAFAALAVLFAVLPGTFKGTHWLDTRFAIMFALLMFAGFSPVRLPRRAGVVMAAALGLLLLARTGAVAWVWAAHGSDVAQFRSVIADIPPGSRVFVLSVNPADAPDYWEHSPPGRLLGIGHRLDLHLSALLLIERHAFWPGLFANPAQQPVARRQPYEDLARYYRDLPSYAALAADRTPADSGRASLFDKLACRADYVLLQEAGADPDLAAFGAGYLDRLKTTDIAALFKVRAPTVQCPIAAMPAHPAG